MKRLLVAMFTVAGIFASVLVTGCSDQTAPEEQAPIGVTNEEAAMTYFATNDEFVRNDEVTFHDLSVEPLDYGTFGKVDAGITPLRFARVVTGVTRTVTTTVQPGDTMAVAYVKKDITGVFKIKAVTAEQETVLIEKPFNDVAERNIIFKRIARNTRQYWLNWVPVAVSLVKGGTVAPNNTIAITELTLFLPDGETVTISDPTSYYLYYRWVHMFQGSIGQGANRMKNVPELIGGQPVRLQVKLESASPDTDIVALRYGFAGLNGRRMRMNLVSETFNGEKYVRVYEISRTQPAYMHFYRGHFHMGVDAITHDTVFDDAAPYAASWWGVPYRVF